MTRAMKFFIVAITGVGLTRFALTLAQIPDETVKYASMSVIVFAGTVYFALRSSSHRERLKDAYLLILPYMTIELIGLGYTWASGRSTIFHSPKYNFNTTLPVHTVGHLVGGLTWEPLSLFLIMEMVWGLSTLARRLGKPAQARLATFAVLALAPALGLLVSCSTVPDSHNPLLSPSAAAINQTAPATYKALFSTSKGDFTIEVHRDWAPRGADRFYNLVKNGFYDDVRFFRVIRSPRPFMAQFGISGTPEVATAWTDANIQDDPVQQHNTRGLVTFATAGPNTRTTQIFINYADNSQLDASGFAPFGQVISGMDVVDSLYAEYGEGAPQGAGPDQQRIEQEGNKYLRAEFPKLDYVKTARIVE